MTADVVRNVTIKLNVKQEPFVVRGYDTSPVTNSLKKIEAETKATFDRVTEKARASLANASQESQNRLNSAALMQSGEGLKMAGEGAFHVARGIALMNIESEEELALVVKKIAYYQGMFDIYKGGLDVVKGVSTATKAMAIAHSSASVAAAIQAGTVGNLTVTMIAAKGAAMGLWNAMTGPVGLAVIGTTAAVGAGYLAWQKYGASIDSVTEKLERQVVSHHSARHALDRLREATIATDKITALGEKSKALRAVEFTDPAMTNGQKLARIEKEAREDREKMVLDVLRAGLRPQDDHLGDSIDLRKRYVTKANPSQFADITSNPRAMLDAIKRSSGAVGVGADSDLEQNLERQRVFLAGATKLRDIRQQTVPILEQEHDKLKQLLQTERDRQKAVEDRMQALKLANMSNIERYGAMDPLERAKLQDAAKELKVNNGDASKLPAWQQEILTKSGLATGAMSRLNIDRGLSAGGEQLLKDLGTNNITPIEAAQGIGIEGEDKGQLYQTQRKAAIESVNAAQDTLSPVVEKLAKQRQELEAAVAQFFDISGLIDQIKAAITIRDEDIKRIKEDVANQADITEKQRAVMHANEMRRRGVQG